MRMCMPSVYMIDMLPGLILLRICAELNLQLITNQFMHHVKVMTCDVLADVDDSDDDNVDKIGISSHQSEIIILCNNLGEMQKQKTEATLWVKTYRQNTEPEKYYHSRLIVYFPWSNEDELIGS